MASIFQESSGFSRPQPGSSADRGERGEKKEKRGKKKDGKESPFHSSEISDRVERARRKIISQTSHRFPVPTAAEQIGNEIKEDRQAVGKGELSYFRQIFTPTIPSTSRRSQRPNRPIFFDRVIHSQTLFTSILSKISRGT